MTNAAGPRWPADENVIPPQVREQQGSRVGVGLGHGVSRRPVPGCLPSVEKGPAWDGGRTPPGEQTDLVGVGRRAEVAAHNANWRLAPRQVHGERAQPVSSPK